MTKNDGVAHFVRVLIKSGKSDEIYDTLITWGVKACVARDWANELRRRQALSDRRDIRATRKLMSSSTRKNVGSGYRRILKTWKGRDCNGRLRDMQFHATKGRREYRIVQ